MTEATATATATESVQTKSNTHVVNGREMDLTDTIPMTVEELLCLSEHLKYFQLAECAGCVRTTLCLKSSCGHHICSLCFKENIRTPCPGCPQVDNVNVIKNVFSELSESFPDIDSNITGQFSDLIEQALTGKQIEIKVDEDNLSQFMSTVMKGFNCIFSGIPEGKALTELLSSVTESKNESKSPCIDGVCCVATSCTTESKSPCTDNDICCVETSCTTECTTDKCATQCPDKCNIIGSVKCADKCATECTNDKSNIVCPVSCCTVECNNDKCTTVCSVECTDKCTDKCTTDCCADNKCKCCEGCQCGSDCKCTPDNKCCADCKC